MRGTAFTCVGVEFILCERPRRVQFHTAARFWR